MSNLKYLARIGIAATALSLSMGTYVSAETKTSKLLNKDGLLTHSISGNSGSGGAGGQRSSGLSSYMKIYGETSAPLGFMNFCSRYPSDCTGGTVRPTVVELDFRLSLSLSQTAALYIKHFFLWLNKDDLYGYFLPQSHSNIFGIFWDFLVVFVVSRCFGVITCFS